MATPSSRPRLRPIETIFVSDPREGRLLVLRDTQGVVHGHVAMPAALAAIIGRFTGRRTCEEIARDVSLEVGGQIPVDAIVRIATQLEDALYCHGPRFQQALARAHREFADTDVRPPSHAGGAYAATPHELRAYLDGSCLDAAKRRETGKIVGLIAPHIDPWRGAVGYGHAYSTLAARLPEDADTFIVFGTSHAPMREPF